MKVLIIVVHLSIAKKLKPSNFVLLTFPISSLVSHVRAIAMSMDNWTSFDINMYKMKICGESLSQWKQV